MPWVQARHDQNHMATTFEFCISCRQNLAKHAALALHEAHEEISALEKQLSEFLPGSPVSQLNENPAGTLVPLPEAVRSLLALAEEMKKKSGGAFDHLSKSKPNAGKIVISENKDFFSKTASPLRLSFGAIGKGFALDKARLLLERAGFDNFLLNAGGSSIALSGFAGPEKPWAWSWSWEKIAGQYRGKQFIHHSGKTVALGVSGFLEQGEHIINPLGGSSLKGISSALLAHASATKADALSTALFVRGWEKNELYYDALHATPMALIEADGSAHWNGDFQSYWGPVCAS